MKLFAPIFLLFIATIICNGQANMDNSSKKTIDSIKIENTHQKKLTMDDCLKYADSSTHLLSGVGYKNAGTGPYDSSGEGIFKRKILNKNSIKVQSDLAGIVCTKVCVNRKGENVYSEIIMDGTTIKEKSVLKEVIKACKNTIFEADPKAPSEQCGKLVIEIESRD